LAYLPEQYFISLHQLHPFASWAVLSMPTTDSREAGGEMVTGEATCLFPPSKEEREETVHDFGYPLQFMEFVVLR
jgi:hypothetical protein